MTRWIRHVADTLESRCLLNRLLIVLGDRCMTLAIHFYVKILHRRHLLGIYRYRWTAGRTHSDVVGVDVV